MIAAAGLGLLLTGSLLAGCRGATTDNDAAAGDTVAIHLEEVATIGCATCAASEPVNVFAMAMGSDGIIWSLDRYEPYVHVFRATGEPVRTFGRRGEGPGEFRPGPLETLVTGLAAYPELDGGLSAHQMFPPAVVQFDAEGNHRGDLAIEVQNPFGQGHRVLTWDAARRVVYALTVVPRESGFRIDRLALNAEPLTLVTVTRGADLFPGEDPAATRNQWFGLAVAPDGTLAVGDSLTYRIVRIDGDGNLLGSFVHDAPRPRKDEGRLISDRASARRRGDPESSVDEEDAHFGRRAFEFDDEGRLWVWVNRPYSSPSVFDLFAPDGTHLGTVEIPEEVGGQDAMMGSAPAFQVAAGYLAAPVVGPDGNDLIKVWRLVQAR